MEINPRNPSTFPSASNAPTEGVLREASASAHGAVDKAAASAQEAVGVVKPAIERVAHAAHQTVDKVTGLAVPTAEWLARQSENLSSTGRNAVVDARAYVSAHPWQSLGVALVAGYLIGRRAR